MADYVQDHTMTRKKSYPEQHRTIGALLRTPYQHLAREVYDELGRCGHSEVRQAHSVVFRYILPEGSRITDLAEQAGMTKQSMASLVEHLRKHGYLRIDPDPADGRAKRVVLTERGRAVQQEAMRLSRKVEQRWAAFLGAEDMGSLRALLERLYDYLEESPE